MPRKLKHYKLAAPVIVPAEIINLSLAHIRIFGIIWYDSLRRGFSTLSNKDLAELSGLSEQHVKRTIRKLKKLGFITITASPWDAGVRIIRIVPYYFKKTLFELYYAVGESVKELRK